MRELLQPGPEGVVEFGIFRSVVMLLAVNGLPESRHQQSLTSLDELMKVVQKIQAKAQDRRQDVPETDGRRTRQEWT